MFPRLPHAIIMTMASLNLADMVVTFLAFLGPQKVLLAFARLARTLDPRSLRIVAVAAAVTAACIGVVCAFTAPWLAKFFHISTPALELASGAVFFVYAIGLVLGIHFDPADVSHLTPSADEEGDEEAGSRHPVISGFRTVLLPFVVSPLAVAAVLEESLDAKGWGARGTVAAAFALVAVIDAVAAVVLAPLLRRTHESILEVLSRLLGLLLAAVGAQLFLNGLTALGVLHGTGH
jgi:small neutral amino acid transporter SnatA (MarC family)